MSQPTIRFDDGAAYERAMGAWSRLVGEVFLDWLKPEPGLRWLDVGCGNGAFTEQIVERCAPSEVQGIDPSGDQIAFARTRPGAAAAVFQQGHALALPFAAGTFDAAVMALVIAFVPDPAKAVAELVRVVRPGGLVATYMWDVFGGGVPTEPVMAEVQALGSKPALPPSAPASRMEALRGLWAEAGLQRIETRPITVRRRFENFDSFWEIATSSGIVRATLEALDRETTKAVKERVGAKLPADDTGAITCSGCANAILGYVPSQG